jgi:DNA-binding transcriptional ArsR family regulator
VAEPGDDLQERLVKAVAHPLRHRVLAAIDESGEASPKQVAAALGEPLGRVSHHVRVLARLGTIELTRTEPRRGATEHYYRAAVTRYFDDEAAARLPDETRQRLVTQYLQRLIGDSAAAAAGTGFDHPRAHISFTLMELDEPGMEAVADLLEETLHKVQELKAEALARLGDAEPAMKTEIGILHFGRS